MEISAFPSICLFQPPSERPNPAPLKPLQPSGSRGVFHPCLLSFLCRNLEVDFDYLLSALGMVTVTMANDVPNWAGSLHSSLTMNHLGDPKSSGFDGPELCRHSQPCRSKGSCSQLLCPVWIGLLQSFEVPWVLQELGPVWLLGGSLRNSTWLFGADLALAKAAGCEMNSEDATGQEKTGLWGLEWDWRSLPHKPVWNSVNPQTRGCHPVATFPLLLARLKMSKPAQILWLIVASQGSAVAGLSCKPQMLFALLFASVPFESSAAVLSNSYHS